MLYKNKNIKDLDYYYGIGSKDSYKKEDCIKIQEAFSKKNILLTLFEPTKPRIPLPQKPKVLGGG